MLRAVGHMLSVHLSITSLSHSLSHLCSIQYQLDTHHHPIVSMISHDYIILLITQTSKPPTSWPNAYPDNLLFNTLVLSRYVCVILSTQFHRSIIFPLSKCGHRVEVGTERQKATFRRYDYQFLQTFRKVGRWRERTVSIFSLSFVFLPF